MKLVEFYRGKVILVTGGSGFVGTNIIQELLKHGAKVRATIHKRPMILSDSRIEVIGADVGHVIGAGVLHVGVLATNRFVRFCSK